ncbi:MAG TPA: AraC family transcriptional regulator [Ruminiclostridium sp.]
MENYPILLGDNLFRKNESICINKSNELPEFMSIVHKHDFIEIAYVISGSGVHIVGEKQYEVSRGDLFIINLDVPHCFFPKEGNNNPPIVYNCIFMPQFLDLSLFSSSHFEDIASSFLFKSLFPDDYTPHPDLRLNGAEFQEIGDLFEKMYSEYRQMKKGYGDLIRAYLIELIVKIFRYMEDINSNSPHQNNQELINKAIEFMKMNYTSEITLSDLAIQSFISKNYFSRLFKEVTGTNFSDYIQFLRTDHACILLKTTDMKVTDIAFQVGFSDIKFFYEVFKKVTGKTPGDFRKVSKV